MFRTRAHGLGTVAGTLLVAATLWVGLSGTLGATPAAFDPETCLPTCTTAGVDGRFLVVAGNDPTTLAAVEITIGLNYTAATSVKGNFQLYDGDRNAANWDVPFVCAGCAENGAAAPELIMELYPDPAGIGGSGDPIDALAIWGPGFTPFPTINNGWSGVAFDHDALAISGTNYQYALKIRPANPAVDIG